MPNGNQAKVVGLTGSIASGKSTVAAMFKELGACIIDADQLAREVVIPEKPAWQDIRRHFGDEILLEDGNINRPKLAEIIFANDQAREELNRIVHPRVFDLINDRIGQAQEQSCPLILVDVPLLYENNRADMYEQVIVVYVPQEIQLQRLIKRNGLSEKQAMQRIASQMSPEEKRKYADFVIDNSGSLDETRLQVQRLYEKLTG